MDTCQFMLEFSVGSEVDIEEQPPPGESMTIDWVPNPVLETLPGFDDAD